MQYENKILHFLLDRYENSLLSRGENKVAVHIAFPFTKKLLPAYFDESSMAFEDIHAAIKNLEQKGYIHIIWKKGKENHIVQKVILNEENVSEVYRYVKRTPKAEMEARQIETLKQLAGRYHTPVAKEFIAWLERRIREGKPVKEFLDLEDTEETKKLAAMVGEIEENQEEAYIREFSGRKFGDTKLLEKHLGIIGKIMRRFSPAEDYKDMEVCAILAEYGIYHTPNYVYVKGAGKLCLGRNNTCIVDLADLYQGIGLSGEDLDVLRWTDLSAVKRVITIENLTTFFRWKEKDSIIIYLGGYHNMIRRKLLQNIHAMLPEAEYLHFGDIDVGGFEIYLDLCKKTGIAFKPYLMGIEQLQHHAGYAKDLSENDRKRISLLLEREESCRIAPVLQYMQAQGIKLEQECIRDGFPFPGEC